MTRWLDRLRWRPSRMALRIYLIGLVQFIIVAIVVEIDHRSHEAERMAAGTLPGPPPDGPPMGPPPRQVGSPPRGPHVGPPPPHLGSPPPGAGRDGPHHGPPGPPVRLIVVAILLVVGVSSWLTARSINRPLATLSKATRAFGAGDLGARARMDRPDEIGEVARAFDDMAERIADLLHAERELLANVSHELRTPLARIRVALDLASEADPAVAVASFADIAQDLAELERIVDDILASARLARAPASGPVLPVREERLDPRALLLRSVERFRAAHAGRQLRVELPDTLPAVVGDAVLLRRCIDNLLDNADKYTDRAEAVVTLSARAEADALVVDVIDEGIGISKGDQAHLFEPFFRADRSRTRRTGGLGLGLVLARRIAEAHRGTLTIESELERGTTARIRLPASGGDAIASLNVSKQSANDR